MRLPVLLGTTDFFLHSVFGHRAMRRIVLDGGVCGGVRSETGEFRLLKQRDDGFVSIGSSGDHA